MMPTTDLAHPPQLPRASRWRRRAAQITAVAASAALLTIGVASPASADASTDHDLARTAIATASGYQDNQDGSFPAQLAVDGDDTTRWASGTPDDTSPTIDPQWLELDLGTSATIDSLELMWEASAAKSYTVEVAQSDPEDAASWTNVYTQDGDGPGGTQDLDLGGVTAQYVRITMTEQTPNDWEVGSGGPVHYYGFSLYTVKVMGVADSTLVGFADGRSSLNAGETGSTSLVLNQPLAADGSVHVTSVDGSATVADGDFTAIDEDVTIPAGETSVDVSFDALDHHGPSGTEDYTLELSDPSPGLALGQTTTHTVSITTVSLLPSAGTLVPQITWEDGMDGFLTFADDDDSRPTLEVVQEDRPGTTPGENHVFQMSHPSDDVSPGTNGQYWGGFYYVFPQAQSWKDGDAVSFWFKGSSTGEDVKWDVKSDDPDTGNEITFTSHFTDDSSDWRQITVAYADLRSEAGGQEDLRFNPREVTGISLTTTPIHGADQIWQMDDFGYVSHVGLVDDFEGTLPFTTDQDPVGIFAWTGGGGTAPTLEQQADDVDGKMPAGNNILGGSYQTGTGWGGFNVNHDSPMDWSSYGGIRFWWYASQENQPTSPTAGNDITIELREDGVNADQSELWDATFLDTWGTDGSRWELVSIPFSSFKLRGDFQPTGGPIDGKLTLKKVWGYDFNLPVVSDLRPIGLDQVVVYGAAASPSDVTVSADPSVVLTDAGDAATVSVSATTIDGNPLAGDVTVHYETGSGSAVAGADYTAASGDLTFPAGSDSGSAQTFTVQTTTSTEASEAKTIPIELTTDEGAVSGSPEVVINAHGLPYLDPSKSNEERADDLLSRMTEDEKIGQMTQAERLGLTSDTDIAQYGLGSVLSGGGSVPADNSATGWADMVDGFQRQALSTRLQIPLLYGVDAVHGHNNVVGATIFPHNIGMGATHDPALEEAAQQVTAQEVKATGVQWAFSPCLCVTQDKRWGRTYESFSEDPALVSQFSAEAITGLQGDDPDDMSGPDKVLATAKHWVGDGGTEYGSGRSGYPIDQGNTKVADMDELMRLYVDPYLPAIDAGVGSIMPSYSSVQIGDGPVTQMHEDKALNTDLLKDQLGFKGFLISDYEGINKLTGSDYADKAVRSVNAGLDMAMAPYDYKSFISAIQAGVQDDEIAQSRIDDAVKRILVQKFALGLFEQPLADRTHASEVGSEAHRQVARQAVAESQVLLKNADDTLPLSAGEKVYVTGSSSDDIGRQSGGWTISWQGSAGDITTGTTIGQAIVDADGADNVTLDPDGSTGVSGHYDVGVVVVGEKPYAEGVGDIGNTGGANTSFELSAADQASIDSVCQSSDIDSCVVLVVSGRPQLVGDQLGEIDGLVASYLPGTEGEGVADVLFGAQPFTGRLAETWLADASQARLVVGDDDYTPQFPYGWGLRTDSARARLTALVDELGTSAASTMIRRVLDADVWASDGSVSDPATALPLLQQAAAQLNGNEHVSHADAVVSVARDVAQAAVVDGDAPADAAALTSDAEHEWASGNAGTAVRLLAQTANVSLPESGDQPVTLSDDATLSGITVDGKPLSGFAAGTTSYTVELAAGASVPVVAATAADDEATVQVDAAAAVPGTTTITVTAADGTTTMTYTVAFTVADRSTPQHFSSTGKVKVKAKGKGKGVRLGRRLKARVVGESPAASVVTYQWFRGAKAITKHGTSATYRLRKKDVHKKVHVVATLHRTGFVDATVSSPARKVKKAKAKVKIKKMRVVKVKHHERVRFTVKVKAAVKAKGKVTVQVGKKHKKLHKVTRVRLHHGKAKVTLPKRFTRGKKKYVVRAVYKGSATVTKAKSKRTKIPRR